MLYKLKNGVLRVLFEIKLVQKLLRDKDEQ